jgi:hypothetical protein
MTGWPARCPFAPAFHILSGGNIGVVHFNVADALPNVAGLLSTVAGALSSVDGTLGNVDGTLGNVGGTLGNVDGTLGNVGGALGNVGGALGNVAGALGNVAGAVGNVAGAVGNVAGAVGNVAGAVGNVAGALQRWRTGRNRATSRRNLGRRQPCPREAGASKLESLKLPDRANLFRLMQAVRRRARMPANAPALTAIISSRPTRKPPVVADNTNELTPSAAPTCRMKWDWPSRRRKRVGITWAIKQSGGGILSIENVGGKTAKSKGRVEGDKVVAQDFATQNESSPLTGHRSNGPTMWSGRSNRRKAGRAFLLHARQCHFELDRGELLRGFAYLAQEG